MPKNDFIKSKNATTTAKYKTDSNKVAKIIIAVLMVIWTIASIFTFCMSVENCTNAKADTVELNYVYSGSNVMLPINPVYFGRDNNETFPDDYTHGTLNFQIRLNRSNTSSLYVLTYNFGAYYTTQESDVGLGQMHVGKSYYYMYGLRAIRNMPTQSSSTVTQHTVNAFLNRTPLYFSKYSNTNSTNFINTPFILCFIQCSSADFTANITKVIIDNYIVSYSDYHALYPDYSGIGGYNLYDGNLAFNRITYYDANNHYLTFEFPAPTTAVLGDPDLPNSEIKNGFVLLQNRTYFTDNYLGSDVAFKDSFDDGFSQGRIEGFEDGRLEGYANGFIVGKAEGYNEGLNDSNSYNFGTLLTSIIDVPLNAFRSLFNFEFLGINLTSFFLSLFTVALILIVVRKII